MAVAVAPGATKAPKPGTEGDTMASKFNMNGAWKSVDAKFKDYKDLVRAVAEGHSRHLIVRGDPGLGKSYECEEVLAPFVHGRFIRFNRATGHMTPLALYNNLFEFRGPKDISMFDDCDSVFKQNHSMNLLKAATDTKDDREIVWGSTSSLVAIDRYRFDGKIILLTNCDMEAAESYNALIDRVIYFDLNLTAEEKTARILHVLHKAYKGNRHLDDVCEFMIDNYLRFGKKLSIRSGVKLMELAEISPSRWQDMAEATVLPRKPFNERGKK